MSDPHDVCACGDSRKSHPGGVGPCGYCAQSRAPYDTCMQFRFSHSGEPITLQSRARHFHDKAQMLSDECDILRTVLTRIVAEFTSGDTIVQCAHCGETVEMCRCVIDLGRTALAERPT